MRVNCVKIDATYLRYMNIQFSDKLRLKGFRVTKVRLAILTLLHKNNSPFDVETIKYGLQKNKIFADAATIYRCLNAFTNEGLLRRLEFEEGKYRYELIDSNNHHHHLVCNNCGNVEDITIHEKTILAQVKRKSDFEILKHSLEFFGRCADCQ